MLTHFPEDFLKVYSFGENPLPVRDAAGSVDLQVAQQILDRRLEAAVAEHLALVPPGRRGEDLASAAPGVHRVRDHLRLQGWRVARVEAGAAGEIEHGEIGHVPQHVEHRVLFVEFPQG